MHDERVDVGCGYAGTIAITAEGSPNLGAVDAVTFKESIQLGVVLGRVYRWTIRFVMAQKELRHVLTVSCEG